MLRVGALLKGYCGGCFADNYEDKRVEAVGDDWVVVRARDSGKAMFWSGDPEYLLLYRLKPSVNNGEDA